MLPIFQRTRRTLFQAVCVTSLVFSVSAQANDHIAKVSEIEGITEYSLDNGLRVLLFPDQTKETVTVNVTYHVGSKHENYGETGMAHLLEHLVFKGTPKHPDIPAELSSHGARPNGTTWTDRTNYFETFSATEENINWALSMESDRMVNSFIAKKDLDSEMTVVRNEFERGENDPFRITLQRMMASAYEWHNYGKSTIGARADLENVPIDRLKAFYKKYYQPDNATLIIAGKFDSKDMLQKVDTYFSPIPKPTRVIDPLYTAEPAQDGERMVTVRRVGDVQMVGSIYHVPAGSHPDFAAIDVFTEVLGATPSGRLHKEVVEKKLASRTFGFNFQWQEPGVSIFFAEVSSDANLADSQAALLSVLEGVTKAPITDKEVERAKRTLIKQLELRFNSSQSIALELSEWVGMGDWRLMFLNRDRIEAVKVEDVQRVADAYFVQNNRTVGRFIPAENPERVEIPVADSPAKMLEGYKGRAQVAQGEAFDPSHDNIASRTKHVTLSNGVKVALLEKKTRGESVVVSINSHLGDEKSLMGKTTAGETVGSMLMRGTDKYTREELKDEFDKLKASATIDGSADNAFARVETTRPNLKATLDLVAEVLKNPSFDSKEFEQYRSTLIVDLEKNLQDPQSLAFNEFSRQVSAHKKGHPNYVETPAESIESIKSVKISDLKAFHDRFYGASSMEVSVVGDFDSAALVKQLESLFGKWDSKQDVSRIKNPHKPFVTANKDFNTPDKENATFVAAITFPVSQHNDDAVAIDLGNYILGGGFLNSRLATRLRQKDGLSYGAGSFESFSQFEENGYIGAYAICAPQNLNKVEVGFKEELARLLKDGFTDEEIAEAKSGMLQGRKVSRSQDKELAGKLTTDMYTGRDMEWRKAYEAKMAALTADDVIEAMRKYISVEKFSIIKAGDLSKAE